MQKFLGISLLVFLVSCGDKNQTIVNAPAPTKDIPAQETETTESEVPAIEIAPELPAPVQTVVQEPTNPVAKIKMTLVDGEYQTTEAFRAVRPYYVMSFSADGFNKSDQALGISANEFNWKWSNDGKNFFTNRILATANGINFDIPPGKWRNIQITVTAKWDSSLQASLVLQNSVEQEFNSAVQEITSIEEYPYSEFDPYWLLGNRGRWVGSKIKYFIPNKLPEGFFPYRTDGYWALDERNEWTWMISNPAIAWLWPTFHYGDWHFHPAYKRWVWIHNQKEYRSHCASFVKDKDFIGWLPAYGVREIKLNDPYLTIVKVNDFLSTNINACHASNQQLDRPSREEPRAQDLKTNEEEIARVETRKKNTANGEARQPERKEIRKRSEPRVIVDKPKDTNQKLPLRRPK